MSQLAELLAEHAPSPEEPAPMDRIQDRARQLRRRSRGVRALALVAVVAVAVPVTGALRRSEQRIAFEPARQEQLGVFDLEALPQDSPLLGWPMRDPNGAVADGTRARVALESAGWVTLIAPGTHGHFCVMIVAADDVTDGQPGTRGGARGCGSVPTTTAMHIEGRGWQSILVPDGYDRATLPDGREINVTNNVVGFASATTDPAIQQISLAGQAGSIVLPLTPSPRLASFAILDETDRDAVASAFVEALDPEGTLVANEARVVDSGAVTVFVAPAAEGDRACLIAIDRASAPAPTPVACTPALNAGTAPFAATAAAGDKVALLIADGWDELELADGRVLPIHSNVVVLPTDPPTPPTGVLRGPAGELIVGIAAPSAYAPPAQPDAVITEEAAVPTFSVLSAPAVPDDPRLAPVRAGFDVGYPPGQADPAATPDLERVRFATARDGYTVFLAPAQTGERLCLLLVPDVGDWSGHCEERPRSDRPAPQIGGVAGAGREFVTALASDGWIELVLDDGRVVPVEGNVIAYGGPAPVSRHGLLRGPAGEVEFGFADTSAERPPAVVEDLADACPADLPTEPSPPFASPGPVPAVELRTSPAGLRPLNPDGTGVPAEYDPDGGWASLLQLGDLLLLGDGDSLGESARIAVVSPIGGPQAGLCSVLRTASGMPAAEIMAVRGTQGVLADTLLVWNETQDVQIQLHALRGVDRTTLLEIAEALVVLEEGPAQ